MIHFPFTRPPRPSPAGAGLKTIIIGAGQAGCAIARDLQATPEYGLRPVAFLDDSPVKKRIRGVPVLGGIDDLPPVVVETNADVVILAITALPAPHVRRLVEAASSVGVSVRYLPSFLAAVERDARVTDLRQLRVDQLLGREELRVVRSNSRSVVEGKVVLITGAGGSIGSELCRQVKGFAPRALYMLDHDESNLHALQMALDGKALLTSDHIIIADIRDANRIRQVFQAVRPQIVFHAAAHKHLPLLEIHPCEGVKTNVLGTEHLVSAAAESGVERFILISTDKAADPTSVLGATKRLAEILLQAHLDGTTKFASVRFGNVLGSRGSFLSVVCDQLRSGEAVTVTHPDVSRFFMTIEEAVGLVIEAAGMADAGETFVLDMGEPVRIVDLVRNTAVQMHVHEEDLKIEYTGLRPGEKLFESLFGEDEERIATAHPRIWGTRSAPPSADLPERLDELFGHAEANRADDVRGCLAKMVSEYRPTLGMDLVSALQAPYPDGF